MMESLMLYDLVSRRNARLSGVHTQHSFLIMLTIVFFPATHDIIDLASRGPRKMTNLTTKLAIIFPAVLNNATTMRCKRLTT